MSKDKLKEKLADRVAQSTGAHAAKPAAPAAPVAKDPRFEGVEKIKNAERIPLSRIVPDPNQPRKDFEPESIDRTGESLREHGQLQPILVRYDSTAKVFVIIDGERRYRAAKSIGMPKLLCLIETADLTATDLLIRQTIANDLREDLNEVERANVLKFLMEQLGLEAQQAADRLKMSKFRASRCLSLLGLAPEVQEMVKSGDLPASTATQLTKLEDPADQVETARRIVDEGLSRDSATREINVLAELREDEKIQEEADSTPADEIDPADVALSGGGAAVATAKPPTLKQEINKAKKKLEPKKPEKIRKLFQYSHGGYKITVERPKGVELNPMLLALENACQSIRDQVKAKHEGKPADQLLKN